VEASPCLMSQHEIFPGILHVMRMSLCTCTWGKWIPRNTRNIHTYETFVCCTLITVPCCPNLWCVSLWLLHLSLN